MKRAIVISYFFPPIYSVESTMALNSFKYLSRYGWKSTVVTTLKSKEFGQDNSVAIDIPPEMKVMRIYSWENYFSRIFNWLGIVSDAMFGWKWFALQAIRNFNSETVDAIISRANPITSHLVARQFKRRLGSQVPWVALFGDPWTQNPYISYRWPWVKPYREWIEKKIIQDADAIVFTTELTKQLVVNKYGLADKMYVLPNTYDPEEFGGLNDDLATLSASNPCVFTYAGNLYGLRSPEPLFRAVQLIKQDWPSAGEYVKFKFIGSVGDFAPLIFQYQIQDLVEIVGQLPRRQTLQELARSHILISIDAPEPSPSIFLPAKLTDYLALNKPILAITPAGETDNLIQTTGAGVSISPNDPKAIAEAIKQYYQLYSQNKLTITSNPIAVNNYSAIEYGRKLADLLNQLAESKTS